MKDLLCAAIIGAAALLATPATAHVVQATSSLSLTDVDVHDTRTLEAALKDAVKRVLSDTIAFQPTFVALTDAQVIGERLYFRVLIADAEGERTLAELNGTDAERSVKARTTL
jgi:hypothetical protein